MPRVRPCRCGSTYCTFGQHSHLERCLHIAVLSHAQQSALEGRRLYSALLMQVWPLTPSM